MRNSLLILTLVLTAACGGGGSGGSNLAPGGGNTPTPPQPQPPPPPSSSVASTSAYVPTSTYAGVLRNCTYAGDATQSCTLGTLPFLGMETNDPDIDDILARTLVSHAWMGRNLERVLKELPPDVLPLFRSITAVVIASDVRPAHYKRGTGAIYLDPDFLWLSVAERDTVSTAPDPRSNFGLDLNFEMPWRYVRNNQRLTVFVNPDGSRDLSQIEEIMAFLLYHELAHAVDFMPPDRLALLRNDETVRDAIARFAPLSSSFVAAMPLTSVRLAELAEVSFLGEDSTPEQRSLQPDDLVQDFANDGATQYYAYTTQFEDFASLFESAMMKWRYGYDKDTAITNRPASGFTNDAIVSWGTRGRLGEQMVRNRVLDVGQRIYPGDVAAFEAFLLNEPTPQQMQQGQTWGQNLVLAPVGPTAAEAAAEPGPSRQQPDYFLERVRIR